MLRNKKFKNKNFKISLSSAICQSLEFYKKMVAFVMAYSFTEPSHGAEIDDGDSSDEEDSQKSSPPMMVPVADILNHVTNNNAHLVFEKDYLTMVATRAIKAVNKKPFIISKF